MRLDGGHHPDVAHRADRALAHRAVEHLVVLGPQAGGVHHVAVLGDVLGDRLDLLVRVAEVLQRARHGLVDDLHGAAADQLLELDQGQVGLDAGGVAVHHEADGVVTHHAIRDVGDIIRHGQVISRLDAAVFVHPDPLEEVAERGTQPVVERLLEDAGGEHARDTAVLTQRQHHRVTGRVIRRDELGPHLVREEHVVLLRGQPRFELHDQAVLSLADEADDFAEVERVVDVAEPHLEDGAAPATYRLPRRGGQTDSEQQGADLGRERLMSGRQAGHAVEDRAVRFEQTAQEGAVDHRVVRLEDRRRNPRNPSLAAVIGVGQALGEPRSLPPARQPDGLQGQLLITLLWRDGRFEPEEVLG